MKKAILARKVGMTQIFNEEGALIPVTVLQAGPCVVTQIKTVENDGYSAVQVGFEDIREKLVNKPKKGHFDKAGVSYKRFVREFKLEDAENYSVKDEIKAGVFKGKGMPGHMGCKKITIQNLEIVRVDAEKNLLLVKGAVPGPRKALVTIRETVKTGK